MWAVKHPNGSLQEFANHPFDHKQAKWNGVYDDCELVEIENDAELDLMRPIVFDKGKKAKYKFKDKERKQLNK